MEEPAGNNGAREAGYVARSPFSVDIVAESHAMKQVMERCHSYGGVHGPVLITGESGTGKSLVAGLIHKASKRKGRFLRRGCGELSGPTAESLLFGHTDDAYTGARTAQEGIFHQADKGTLVLDDIDYLPKKYQPRLMRFLDDGAFCRLGETGRPVVVDCRFVATTNKNLESYAREGHFLEDLFYRLIRWRVHIPPLRERPADIRELAIFFLRQFQQEHPDDRDTDWWFEDDVLDMMCRMDWPGNARTLKAAVQNIALADHGGNRPITRIQAMNYFNSGGCGKDCGNLQPNEILQILTDSGWNISRAAKIAGMARGTLYKHIDKNGWKKE
ncbi:sigma 54-interacting transcriptional regulator [Desulfovibrio sp. JC010]|uniref:sigma 54-interacting transcriptional regulator n=1 Tax=Desulfovibrio sp. JC010 TaxID=2593641 RepID=UPI0013CFD6C4|nr:sigma 54-interacting transcriptional regulator [Desulfovibrio sp. JC010]NDV28064.1 sigma-54-dependent Fis family transcriptional regulator [Desulfovibrio sp. JC010]